MNIINREIYTESPISIWKAFFIFFVATSSVRNTATLTIEDYKAFGIHDRSLQALGLVNVFGGQGPIQDIGNFIQMLLSGTNLKDTKVPPPQVFVETPARVVEMASFSQANIEFIMKSIVVIEKQGANIANYIQGVDLAKPVINAILMALETARGVLKLIKGASDKALTEANTGLKAMDHVARVVLGKTQTVACVIVGSTEKFSSDKCIHCQKSIPDFMDKGGAQQTSKLYLEKLLSTGPKTVEEYLEVLKRVTIFSSRYLDGVMVCCQDSPSNTDSCRDTSKESTITTTLASMLEMGKNILDFVTKIGGMINSNNKSLLGRVATTHAAYQSCLVSGSSEASKMGTLKLEDMSEFFEKMKAELLSTAQNITQRALNYQKVKQLRLRAMNKP